MLKYFSNISFSIPAFRQKLIVCLAILLLVITSLESSHCYPIVFRDSSGRDISINREPESVVSLVPSITEIICKIGAEEKLKGITYHSRYPSETAYIEKIGGFLSPDIDRVAGLKPEIIFYNDIQKDVVKRYSGSSVILIDLEAISIEKGFEYIELLGKIFKREKEAGRIILENRKYIEHIEKKTRVIPGKKRKRVMRIMGRKILMTPGDDSFQREFIELAGGIPPVFNRNGSVITISSEELIKFNPQLIYGCGMDRIVGDMLLSTPECSEVEAVKNNDMYYFPCDLTCRASTNVGYFVDWLSARIYRDEFSKKENVLLPDKVIDTKKIDVDLSYVKDCRIDNSVIYDFTNRSLVIEFIRPLNIISTLEGYKANVSTIGNNYTSLAGWAVGHNEGFEGIRKRVLSALGKTEKDASFLFTAADVDKLAVVKEKYKDLEVYALVTAGVESNAMRMSKDDGGFYEPGTINILILPNMKITERAMTRAIVTATEAKSAALQDLDIRSSYRPEYQATGTGTDNIIIVEGSGGKNPLDTSGGHTKLGELIAGVVYKGVKQAIYNQNGLLPGRDIFQKLEERKISIGSELSFENCDCGINENMLRAGLEKLLLEPEYASFVSASFSISDDFKKGLISDLTHFEKWCITVAQEISGSEISEMDDFFEGSNAPAVIKMALNAIINGFIKRESKRNETSNTVNSSPDNLSVYK